MLNTTEEKCLDLINSFVRSNSDFRPVPIENKIHGILDHIDEDNILFLLKGSYKTRMLMLGIMAHHDLSEFQFSSNTSVFYMLSCKAPLAASLYRENASDKITKEIGLKIEIELGDREIDDHYLINSNKPEMLKGLIQNSTMGAFLKLKASSIEEFTIRNGIILYRKNFKPATETHEQMETDIQELYGIAEAAEALI